MFPGDYYIDMTTLKFIMALADDNQYPDLVYGGSIIRDGRSEVKILIENLQLNIEKWSATN